MDILPDFINMWLLNYGSFALFFLLALGIIALPVPEETLLVVSGFLICQGVFSWAPTFIAAYLGSVTGITVSYIIGRTGGLYVINKYGKYIQLTHSKMNRVHNWFEHYGKWVLFFGYFIPGVRHFTGVFAGISSFEYHHFALYAYTGALFWVTLFLSIGYFFGNWHEAALTIIESNLEAFISGVFVTILVAIYLKVRSHRKKKHKHHK